MMLDHVGRKPTPDPPPGPEERGVERECPDDLVEMEWWVRGWDHLDQRSSKEPSNNYLNEQGIESACDLCDGVSSDPVLVERDPKLGPGCNCHLPAPAGAARLCNGYWLGAAGDH